ncbi:MAG TPA: lipocalin-like domain-containing protein [Burkholderiales bacterium]|nr:lipocalin-like domain-containing protein [Burkholderiales bacterium]
MERFVGVWRLERWSSGAREPFGAAPLGTLVYTAEGTMVSCFSRRHREAVAGSLESLAAWRREWREHPAPALEYRLLAAALAFNAYSGRFSVEGDHVHHDVEVALFPEWIGRRLTRRYRFEGERLSLGFGDDELVWRRA